MPVLIPLRAYRVAPRKPWLAVDGADLLVRVPSWWGGRPWRVPVADVGVAPADLWPDVPEQVESDEDVVFAEPVVVPYVYTTGQVPSPNLALVFRQPVPVPPFRLLTRSHLSGQIPVRGARGGRPKGRYVDGLLLRAVDPGMAVETLVAAGAERVADPDTWLASRRERATPEDAAWLDRLERRSRLAERVAIGAGVAVAVVLFGFEDRAWADPVAGSLGVLAFTTYGVGWWTENRMLRGPRD